MKIPIGSLLFATAIFINFPELNSYPPNKRARPATISKTIPFKVFERDIKVDVKISVFNNHCTTERLTVVGDPLPGVPTSHNRAFYNYTTRAVYNYEEGHPVKIVAYIKEDNEKKRTLMGVKLPPIPGDRFATDDPRYMDPDELNWFITYKGTDFTVEVDPETKRVFNVKPRWLENKRPDLEHLNEYGLGYPSVHFGGLHFLVFKKNRDRVVGAALDPYWMYRPGQQLENQNPHVHPHLNPYLNPQLRSQPNPPLNPEAHINPEPHQHLNPHHNLHSNPFSYAHQTPDLNPNANHQLNLGPSQHYPQQIPDQQYHLEQHHNAYQQHNLYSDNFHYPQQTFDPNEIAYHQQNVGPSHHYPQEDAYPPPHFDPSLYDAHQSGHSPPHFDPNQNWDSPPYQSPGR